MMVVVEAGMDIVLWNEGSEILMPEEVWEHRIKTEGFDCIKQYFLVAALKKNVFAVWENVHIFEQEDWQHGAVINVYWLHCWNHLGKEYGIKISMKLIVWKSCYNAGMGLYHLASSSLGEMIWVLSMFFKNMTHIPLIVKLGKTATNQWC